MTFPLPTRLIPIFISTCVPVVAHNLLGAGILVSLIGAAGLGVTVVVMVLL